MDTDNLTEHNLGFWTIHGDVADYNPIGGLWKHEVYELCKYIFTECYPQDPPTAMAWLQVATWLRLHQGTPMRTLTIFSTLTCSMAMMSST